MQVPFTIAGLVLDQELTIVFLMPKIQKITTKYRDIFLIPVFEGNFFKNLLPLEVLFLKVIVEKTIKICVGKYSLPFV